ncbi:hypothetical protein U1Q18_035822 [Sarracenia purpurea var. burkii]
MSLTKEGEDAFEKIREALDSFDKRKSRSDCGSADSALMKCVEQVNGDGVQHPLSSTSVNLQSVDASSTKLHKDSDIIEAKIPSEVITSCVATLLMVQVTKKRSTENSTLMTNFGTIRIIFDKVDMLKYLAECQLNNIKKKHSNWHNSPEFPEDWRQRIRDLLNKFHEDLLVAVVASTPSNLTLW